MLVSNAVIINVEIITNFHSFDMNLFLDRVLDAALTTQCFRIQASLKLTAICLLQSLPGWIIYTCRLIIYTCRLIFFFLLPFWFLCVASPGPRNVDLSTSLCLWSTGIKGVGYYRLADPVLFIYFKYNLTKINLPNLLEIQGKQTLDLASVRKSLK